MVKKLVCTAFVLCITILASCAESGSGTNILTPSYSGAPGVDGETPQDVVVGECFVPEGNAYERWKGTWRVIAFADKNVPVNQRKQLKKAGGYVVAPIYTFHPDGRFEWRIAEQNPSDWGRYAVTDTFKYAMAFDEVARNERSLRQHSGTWLMSDTTLFLLSDTHISMVLKRVS